MRDSRWSAPLILLAACAGCNEAPRDVVKSEASEVVVARPIRRDVTDYEEFTGHTDAKYSVQIKARVTGYLMKKDFQDGQEVKKDDILYEIDDRTYKAALDSAESMVARGEAHKARLEADYRRASNLFQRAAIGKQEFDLISSNLVEAEAELGAYKAQLDNARLNMSFTKVRAPMSGQLSRTLVDPGNLVRQDSTVLNDIVYSDEIYAYFDISTDAMERVSKVIEQGQVGGKDKKEVEVLVGTTEDADRYEEAMSKLRDSQDELSRMAGQIKALDDASKKKPLAPEQEEQKKKLAVALAAGRKKLLEQEEVIRRDAPEFPYKGLVDFSENKLDAATGTLRVRGTIKNPAPASILSPGLFVRIRLPIGESHSALLVPEDSIGSDQGRTFVYVVNPRDEVEYRPISVGEKFEGGSGRTLRAIRSGIVDGERFIQDSEALRRVRPGAKVKVLQPESDRGATIASAS